MDYSINEDIIKIIIERAKYLILPSKDNNYRSILLQSKFLLVFVVLLFVFKIVSVFMFMNVPYNIFFADITRTALQSFINQSRESAGLNSLVENQKLTQAAQLKAQDMVQNNYFSHTSPSGITPWYWFKQIGYNYKYAGENLAIGFYDSREVYNAWLNSPSHKANILNPNYTEVGTAVLGGFGNKDTIVVVQEFGAQQPQKIASTTSTKAPSASVRTKPTAPVVVAETGTEEKSPQQITQSKDSQISITEDNIEEKVLSQSTEIKTYIESSGGTGLNNRASKIMGSIIYSHDEWIQNLIYGTSLVIIGILLALIFFNINVKFRRELIFRAVVIIGLLSAATLLNQETVTSLIPHQMFI